MKGLIEEAETIGLGAETCKVNGGQVLTLPRKRRIL